MFVSWPMGSPTATSNCSGTGKRCPRSWTTLKSWICGYADWSRPRACRLLDRFDDLERVERPAAGEVVHHRPEPEPTQMILADRAGDHLVAGGRLDRAEMLWTVGELQVGRGAQRLADPLHRRI